MTHTMVAISVPLRNVSHKNELIMSIDFNCVLIVYALCRNGTVKFVRRVLNWASSKLALEYLNYCQVIFCI